MRIPPKSKLIRTPGPATSIPILKRIKTELPIPQPIPYKIPALIPFFFSDLGTTNPWDSISFKI